MELSQIQLTRSEFVRIKKLAMFCGLVLNYSADIPGYVPNWGWDLGAVVGCDRGGCGWIWCVGSGEQEGRQECNKEKEESREEYNKSRKIKKMKWEDCWELNTSELVLPRDELVLLSQQLVLLEENSSYCSRLQLPVLNQSVNTARAKEGPTNFALMAYSSSSSSKSDSEFNLANYKRGLASVEERLVFYKNNEVIFTDQIAILKSDASFNEAEIIALMSYIEKLKKEKEDNLLKINNYDNATKSLDKVIGSQLVDNNKKGLGYNAVPPSPTGLFAPPIIDLSHFSIEKFKEPEFEGYGVKVSDNDEQDESKPKSEKKTVIPTVKKKEFVKAKQDDKTVRNTLGNEFVMNNKACFACGSLNHLIKDCKRKVQKPIWNNARRVNHHNSHRMSYPHPKRNFIPKAVLMKTGMRPINVAKPKGAYNAVKRNRFNVVKASACWVWMTKNRVVDHVSKNISASVTLKRLDYIDAQGRFKWMHMLRGGKSAAKNKKNPKKSAAKAERPRR
ncbi:putative ribonuclease H-like domain-containing protein [Tanacetum coccineum]